MSTDVWVQVPSLAPRRSKVRFAPTSYYACGKKDVIRPLPCSSFPTTTRYAGLAVGGPSCGRHFSPLRNIDFNRPFQVGASFVSLAPTFFQKSERTRSAAPPFKIEPASLGFNFVLLEFISANAIRTLAPKRKDIRKDVLSFWVPPPFDISNAWQK